MKKKIIYFILACFAFFLTIVVINAYIYFFSKSYILNIKDIPSAHTALVLGAKVYRNGYPSAVLHDRLTSAVTLYKRKKIKKILLSGDHGTKNYDEVNNMKKFLRKQGIPARDIFLDHAGFNTYDSIVRAKKIFLVKKMIIVTQNYHLYRAIFIAHKKGLSAYGYSADKRVYVFLRYYKFREIFANIKACLSLLISKRPRFLGDIIPISGNSKKSWD